MLHIEILTYGNEFKDSQGKIWKVDVNYPDKDRILIELVEVVPVEEFNQPISEV
jgi:hypothetical protein